MTGTTEDLKFDNGAGYLYFYLASATDFLGSVDVRSSFTYTLTDADRANPSTNGTFVYNGDYFRFRDEAISIRYSVPEPASWAMMVVGFGVAGAAIRRRKATVSFA